MLTKDRIHELLVQKKEEGDYENGCFAQVRDRRCGTKVEKISAEDYAYSGYIDWLDETGEVPWAPKIYAKHVDDGACFIVMEKLEEFTELAERVVWQPMPDRLDGFDEYTLEEIYFKNIENYTEKNQELCKDFFKTHITPGFIKWYCDMANEALELGYSTDIHTSNIMWRITPDDRCVLVVTDPWYDSESRNRMQMLRDDDYAEEYDFSFPDYDEDYYGDSDEDLIDLGTCKCSICQAYQEAKLWKHAQLDTKPLLPEMNTPLLIRPQLSEMLEYARAMLQEPINAAMRDILGRQQAQREEVKLELFANNC